MIEHCDLLSSFRRRSCTVDSNAFSILDWSLNNFYCHVFCHRINLGWHWLKSIFDVCKGNFVRFQESKFDEFEAVIDVTVFDNFFGYQQLYVLVSYIIEGCL